MKFIEQLLNLTSATTTHLESVNVHAIQAVTKFPLGEKRIELLADFLYSMVDEQDDEYDNALSFSLTLPIIIPIDNLPAGAQQLRECLQQLKPSELFFDQELELASHQRLIDMDYYDLPPRTETTAKVQQAVGEFSDDFECYTLSLDLVQRGCALLNEDVVDDALVIRQEVIRAITVVCS